MGFQGRGGCGRGCTSARKSFVAETTGDGFSKEAWAPGRLLDSARARRGGQEGGGDSWWRSVAEDLDSERKGAVRAWEL